MLLFDGRHKASQITQNLSKKGTSKSLHSIVVGDENGALVYQKMKQAAAEEIGARVVIEQFDADVDNESIKSKISNLNSDQGVNGIMVQLPLPKDLRLKTKNLIDAIAPEKDVDGMRDESPYLAPVVRAVEMALNDASKSLAQDLKNKKTLVIGSSGFVGQKIVWHLADLGFAVVGVDDTDYLDPYTSSADVIISATGRANVIGQDMVREGVILIDVGAPVGDISKDAYKKASFVSPVPGGIGPLTIACLMENLINSK